MLEDVWIILRLCVMHWDLVVANESFHSVCKSTVFIHIMLHKLNNIRSILKSVEPILSALAEYRMLCKVICNVNILQSSISDYTG